jgi:hypothetical protein
MNPEALVKCTCFALGKGAEVPVLNAQELCTTWGFSGNKVTTFQLSVGSRVFEVVTFDSMFRMTFVKKYIQN